ncbi:hypothetical protein [Modestobacter sp. KNN46-3]|uniref:hypothetical protein n=1 Tax=Modestobacter sp. KNN46-3 TaxID=2711218 RepID=UPI0013DE8675|nr:hypothetical protein [Modestobacter sp. KNN46-3]
MSTTTRALYRTALLATAAELDRHPEDHRAAAAAREAALTGSTQRMRWVLAHPYDTAR